MPPDLTRIFAFYRPSCKTKREVQTAPAPRAAILFDKFHVIRHLGEALDAVRKSEYAQLQGRERRYIKGQKYT
jgi:transposase